MDDQRERDERLNDLVQAMGDLYKTLKVVKDLRDKPEALEDTLQKAFLQTVECAIFVTNYKDRSFVGKQKTLLS